MPLASPAPAPLVDRQEVQRFIGQLPRPPRPARQESPPPAPPPAPEPESGDGGGEENLPSGRIAELPSRGSSGEAVEEGPKTDMTNQELDRLASQLYGRLRARLVNELRLDRERSGHLSDLW